MARQNCKMVLCKKGLWLDPADSGPHEIYVWYNNTLDKIKDLKGYL